MNVVEFPRARRERIVKALRRAKEHLWDGVSPYGRGTSYICFAIDGGKSPFGKEDAKDIVMDRIFPNGSVGGYLVDKLRIPKRQLTQKNIQTFRHLWLDELIREFSA